MTEINGILVLHKPKGFTSHDCVMKVRKLLGMKKVGHTGTLDPDVTGVLPICLGKATKVAEYMTEAGKEYIAEVTLGTATTTEDASGEVIAARAINKPISRSQLLAVFEKLTGEIVQTPPMFSAIKVNGKKLYEYARTGIEIERPKRMVTIKSITLLDEREVFSGEAIRFAIHVVCSKGTYIRTLAVMIGEMLDYPAHMSKLVRSVSAGFTLDEAIDFTELTHLIEKNQVESVIQPLASGVMHLPKLIVDKTLAEKVRNGSLLKKNQFPNMDDPVFAVFDQINELLAIYHHHPSKQEFFKPMKVI